jgi:hypothetical protein
MESGRMPACVAVPCSGDAINTSGCNVLNRADANNYYSGNQALIKGNRCDHDKNHFKKPTFYGSSGYQGKRSYSIKRACTVLEDILGFKSGRAGRRHFSELLRDGDKTAQGILQLFEEPKLAKLFHHYDDAGEIDRPIRSERVESAYALVTRTLINGVDLRTMAFGFWDNKANRQVYFNYDDIAGKTGLTKSRIQRAITLLKEIGLVTVNRVVQTLSDGKIIHKQTQIFLSEDIFALLGLRQEMLEDRRYAMIKWDKEQRKLEDRKKYLDSYRKPPSKKVYNNHAQGLQRLTHKMTTPYAPKNAGNGLKIRDAIQTLVSKGVSLPDAIEAVKKLYPPPH